MVRKSDTDIEDRGDSNAEGVSFESILIAHEHHVEKLTIKRIAELHRLSQPTISRRLAEVKDRIRTIVDVPEAYEKRLYFAVQHTAIAEKLKESMNDHGAGIRRILVTLGDEDPEHEEDDPQRDKRVARHAARLMAAHLRNLTADKGHTIRCGLNWGYFVHDACHYLPEFCDGSLELTTNIELSGISGKFYLPAKRERQRRQASLSSAEANAQLAAASFNNEKGMVVHRINTPIYLNEKVMECDNAKETLETFLGADPGYSELYGSKPIYPSTAEVDAFVEERRAADEEYPHTDKKGFGSIARHDLIVTGFSALSTRASLVRFSDEIRNNLDELREQGICGDLASHLFRKDGSIPRDDSLAGRTNRCAVTLWPEDLQEAANRARKQEYGGVLLCCSSKERAEALHTITTRMRAVNDLVIDANLAYALYPLLGLKDDREKDFQGYSMGNSRDSRD